MKDDPILGEETIRRKRAAISRFLPLLNTATSDSRPYVVEVTARRSGERPRSFGSVTLAPGMGSIEGNIHAHELEIGFVGMVLSLYGDVLVNTGARLLNLPDGDDVGERSVCEHDEITPIDF